MATIAQGGWGVPHKLSTAMQITSEMVGDAIVLDLYSLVERWLLSQALGDTYEPGATMATELALVELGEPRDGDQPRWVDHDECWTCECVTWGGW